MNRRICIACVLFLLSVFAVSSMIVMGASQVELAPTSAAPGDSIEVEDIDFAASQTVAIGWGPQVTVRNDPAIVTKVGDLEFYGTTSQHPIKPGSFKWGYLQGALPLYLEDNGDGTLHDPAVRMEYATINYTSGYFHCVMRSTTLTFSAGKFNYTTYYFNSINSTLPILATDASGAFIANMTVPEIWNGIETVTVIDDAGNTATANFTVYGSDVVPEPLTIGALVLLTSTAMVISFYWLKRKTTNKIVKYS